METPADLINELGVKHIAARTGAKPHTIQKWRQRGRIPGRYWADVIDMANAKGVVEVDVGWLSERAA